jgi:signal transduction histidine kinase
MDEIAAMPSAALAADGLFGTELQPDALRQLIHELRTPLNAVLGFAEMIDGQYLGPAGEGYRTRAQAIREEAGRMLAAVDDLDTAARIETSRFPVEESNLDLAVLLVRLHADYARVAHHRNSVLEIAAAPGLPQAKVEPLTAERMCARLLAATIGLAGAGERLLATIAAEPIGGREMLCLAITRPSAIAGHEEAELLDPGYTPEGDWPDAPALGLGFALRLVRNLAEAVGGTLTITADRFLLHLPAAAAATQRSGEGP